MCAVDETWKPDAPSSARIHNALLGGWNNTAADQAVAAELEDACPQLRQMALDSRLFTTRVTGYAAGQGIRQFIDLGAGLAPPPSVHGVALSMRRDARVAYVDCDAEVCDFWTDVALDGGREGIAVVNADLRNPAAVWSHPELTGVIGTGRPVLILAAMVLHFSCGGLAEALVREYARRAAPGSLIAVSVPRFDDEITWGRVRRLIPEFTWNFTAQEVAGFLGGLELVPPGVCAAAVLRPGWEDCPAGRGGAYVLGAIGRKP